MVARRIPAGVEIPPEVLDGPTDSIGRARINDPLTTGRIEPDGSGGIPFCFSLKPTSEHATMITRFPMPASSPARSQTAKRHAPEGSPPRHALAPDRRAPLLLLGVVFLGAFLLRAAYLVDSADNPFRRALGLDTAHYHEWALSIVRGFRLGAEPFSQAPLYPFFVALCYGVLGTDPEVVLWVQAVLGALAAAVGAWVGWRMAGRLGLLGAGVLLALYRPAIFYTGVLLAPVLVAFLVLCSVALALRWPFAAGVATGLVALAHPTAFPGTALVASSASARPDLFLQLHSGVPERVRPRHGRGGVRLLGWALGVLAAFAPSVANNLVATGRIIPIATNGGFNFYIGNGPQADGFYRPPVGFRGDEDIIGLKEASRVTGRRMSPDEASRFWFRAGFEEISRHPGKAARLFVRKLFHALCAYEVPQVESLDFERSYSALIRFPPLPGWLALLVLGVAGVLATPRVAPLLFLGGALANAVAIAVFFVTGRFRTPSHVFLALAFAGGFKDLVGILGTVGSRFVSRWAGRRGHRTVAGHAVAHGQEAGRTAVRRLVLLVVSAMAVGFVFSQNWYNLDRKAAFGSYFYRLGVLSERADSDLQARRYYERALRLDPQFPRANINLGILEARAGNLDRAQALLERGLALDPRSARGYLALGQLHQLRGDTLAACSLYAKAWAADSSFLEPLEFLFAAKYASGDLSNALDLARRVVEAGGVRAAVTARARFVLGRLAERGRARLPIWGGRDRAEGDLALGAGMVDSALKCYERGYAARLDPVCALEAARICKHLGREAEFRRWRSLFLEAGGDSSLVPLGQRS